jgi:S1-C subfamily serine protease
MLFIILLLFNTVKSENSIDHIEKEIKDVLKKVSPSIVKVISQNHRNYYATGIVLDKHHIITNTIITRYPFKRIYIKSVKGESYPAQIVGKDDRSSILILKIGENDLTPIKEAKKFEVGDWVALVGAFYNKFPSINQGILSSASADEVILNAPVAPGISGGAVVNKKGELIGVIRGRFGFTLEHDYTFKDQSSEIYVRSPRSKSKDLCVAVPMKKVTSITNDLIKFGKIRRGWLGVSIDINAGNVMVTRVTKGSPAEKGGILKGDIILSIDEKAIETPNDIFTIIKTLRPEQKSKIKILRDKREKFVTATIGEAQAKDYSLSVYSTPRTNQHYYSIKPEQFVTIPEKWESIPRLENFIFNISGSRLLGIEALPLTPELAKEFSVKEGFGLLISKIYEKSAAEKAGLKAADIIVEVNNQGTKKLVDLRKTLSEVKEDDKVVLLKIYRAGKVRNIKVTAEEAVGFGSLFDPFKKMREEFSLETDKKNVRKHKEIIELQGGNLLINGKTYDLDQVKKYKMEIEKLRKERDIYKNEVKDLKKILESEKNKNKKATI